MKLINNKYSTLRALEKFLKTTISRPVTSCRTGQDRAGQDRTGHRTEKARDRTGQDKKVGCRTGQDRTGHRTVFQSL